MRNKKKQEEKEALEGKKRDNRQPVEFVDRHRDELYKNRSSRKTDSRIVFSREYDFPKTFSLTENQSSGKT